MRKLLTLVAVVGLIASQLILSMTHATASSKPIQPTTNAKPGHALSLAQMLSTKGTAICDSYQCNNADGCVDFGLHYISWYPKTVCRFYPIGTCNNFANGLCYKKENYAGSPCQGDLGTSTTSNIDYCGL